MPRQAKPKRAADLARLRRPGLHAVGGPAGLCLQITPTGARSWVLRVTIAGRVRHLGLGTYSEGKAALAAARDQARELRRQIRAGRDPLQERRDARRTLRDAQARRMPFEAAARRCYASKAPALRDATASGWLASLERHAFPTLGAVDVSEIDTARILEVVEPIWTKQNPTAALVRGRIEQTLDWAKVRGLRSGENPARWRGHLAHVLPAPGAVHRTRHHRALAVNEVGAFMVALEQREGMAANAMQFLILTAARSGEVRGAAWQEIDTGAAVWTIPAERMKSGREHRAPLSDDALAILAELPRVKDCPYVFPGPNGSPLSDNALSALIKRMKADVTAHGFRSTFRDWCSEQTTYAHEVAEQALAHTIPSAVERAYRRGDLLAKRRQLMADWAAFIQARPGGNVINIREAS